MSQPMRQLWLDDPSAPQTTHSQYFSQKASFSGSLLGAISYGVVVILFFQCIAGLINRPGRGWVRCAIVAHNVAMFLIVTANTAMSLHIQSISYIDNRDFPGTHGALDPGPLGYQFLVYSRPINIAAYIMFFLNNWLADGLLLYRYCVIFSMNYWFVAPPCLMYMASIATGTMLIYQTSQPADIISSVISFGYPFFSVTFSLNVFLTLMITMRIIWCARQCRMAGVPHADITIYTARLVAMLIESFALNSIIFLLYIVPWAANSAVSNFFFPILVETQVIAPFLIIIRVSNRRPLTSDSIADVDSASPIEPDGESPDASGMRAESITTHGAQS